MAAKKKREEYGGSAFDQQYFTDDELRGAAEARAAAQAGKTSWQDAHNYVEDIRKQYGYTGGQNGSGFKSTKTSDAPTYNSPYQRQIDEMYEKVANRQPFSYDYTKDPLYQQYADSYSRNGRRAMQNTLAEISSRTGGLASSYANTAANQAYNSYMSGLADKIPVLQQAAYDMYVKEGDSARNDLSLLQSLDATKYGRYQDALSQYNLDRNYNQALADTEFNRQLQLDEIARQREESDYNRQLALAQLGQSVGDYRGLNSLGISPNLDNIAALTTAGSASLLRGSSGGSASSRSAGSGNSRSGGSSSKSETGSAGNSESDFWEGVSNYAALGGDPADYIKANWKSSGLFNSQTAALSAWKVHQTQAQGDKEPFPSHYTFSDFKRTISGLLQTGQDEKAIELADKYSLTDSQYKELMKVFNSNGYK